MNRLNGYCVIYNSMMKIGSISNKIIAVAIGLLLILSSGGYVFIYQQLITINRIYVYTSIGKDVFDDEALILSFQKSDIESGNISLQWINKNEFRYHGKMYDIVESAEIKDSIFFHVYCDNTENLLESNFNCYMEDEKKNRKQNPYFNNLTINICDLFHNAQADFPQLKFTNSLPPFTPGQYSFTDLEIPLPPPKSYS